MKWFFKFMIVSIFIKEVKCGELIILQYRNLAQKELMKKVLSKNFRFPESVFKYYELRTEDNCPNVAKAILDLCENHKGQIEIKSIDEMILKKFFYEMNSI